jgi:hypothetical protein
MSVTLNGTSGLVFSDGTIQGTAGAMAFRNRIINGDMRIDQRNAGGVVTAGAGNTFYTDRWTSFVSQASKFTGQQNAGSVVPPAGFTNYLGVTSTSSYSVLAGDEFIMRQIIEGFNTADLAWGTANAKAITFSFWVRSSLTGTFGGALRNDGNNRSYPFSYTISSANTWEMKSITIPGDTTGTWLTNNGRGIQFIFSLGAGTDRVSPANAWNSTNHISVPNATSVVGTNGATWYITGVQFEKAEAATSFEHRPFGTELAMCERYFQTGRLTATGDGVIAYLRASSVLRVSMRSTPTFVLTDNAGNVNRVTGDATNNIVGGISGDSKHVVLGANEVVIGLNVFMGGNFTASAEL